MNNKWIRLGIKLAKYLLGILLIWVVVIPYARSLAFDKQYYSKAIYIPATKETIYLIKYNPWSEPQLDNVQISTCDWRIFNDPQREYWYHSIFGGETPFYYKTSNDTLYLTMRYTVETPPCWKTKVKIIQNCNTYINADGKQVITYIDLYSEDECKKWEKQGYTRFP